MNQQLETIFWKGQQLEIETSNKESYFTEVIESESHLFFHRPINNKQSPLTINGKEPVQIYFHDDDKTLYTFHARLQHINNLQFWVKKPLPSAITKAQRRRFFRVQVAVDVNLTLPATKQKTSETIHLNTYDISGGGFSFISEQNLAEDETKLKGTLSFLLNGKQQIIDFSGRTVRAYKLENGMYHNGVMFIGLGEKSRTKIIQLCMAKQIELRNKLRGI